MVDEVENKDIVVRQLKRKQRILTNFYVKFFAKDDTECSVDTQSKQTQTEYVYTILPNKAKPAQKRSTKASVVVREKQPHKVNMEDLLAFSQMNIKDALGPEFILGHKFPEQQIKEFEKSSLHAFCCFLGYWRDDIFFNKLSSEEGCLELIKDADFPKFCEEIVNLFEEFFPFPKKYKLFVGKLAKIIHKDRKKSSNSKGNNFNKMFAVLIHIMRFITGSEHDIFNESDYKNIKAPRDIIPFLKDEKLKEMIRRHSFFKKEYEKIVNDVKHVSDRQIEIQKKLARLANSAFNRNSDPDEESFKERMRAIMQKFSFLGLAEIDTKNDLTWRLIKEKFIKNDSLDIYGVRINNDLIPKINMHVILQFFGVLPANTDILFLGTCDGRWVGGSKIRRDLVAASIAATHIDDGMCNQRSLLCFLKQLSQKERIEIMYSDVQWEGRSLPLLLMFLLHPEKRSITIKIIEEFLPEFFDVEFKVHGEEESFNIMSLLEKMKDFCNKRLQDQDTTKEDRALCENLLSTKCLEKLIDELERIKEKCELQLKLRKEELRKMTKEKKIQIRSDKVPNTKIEVADKKKYEISECCIVNLFRCIAAKVT